MKPEIDMLWMLKKSDFWLHYHSSRNCKTSFDKYSNTMQNKMSICAGGNFTQFSDWKRVVHGNETREIAKRNLYEKSHTNNFNRHSETWKLKWSRTHPIGNTYFIRLIYRYFDSCLSSSVFICFSSRLPLFMLVLLLLLLL